MDWIVCGPNCDCALCEYQQKHDKILNNYKQGLLVPDELQMLLMEFSEGQKQGWKPWGM